MLQLFNAHLNLEYTNNVKDSVNFNALFLELHQTLQAICGVAIENCKSRAVKHDHYFTGVGGDEKGFVCVEILLLQGRTLEVRQKIGNEILAWLKRFYPKSIAQLNMQITVKVDDINRDLYFKFPEGTFTPQK